jgi:ribosomal protein S18 acetylase RimI-like enzyme
VFEIERLTDRDEIRGFLACDRKQTAYALADLDDALWPHSAFVGARRDGALEAVLLFFGGLDPVVMTAFGDADAVRAACEAVALPEEIYYLFLPEMESVLNAYYERPHAQRELRMVLDPAQTTRLASNPAQRIAPEQAAELAALYRMAAEPGEEILAFSPWQIAQGVFFGVWADGALVATAGTHVWSVAEGIAAIGNVFTHPDYRGRGYALACTGAVVAEGLSAGLDTIVLNVREDNMRAIHVYAKLGFRPHCTFLEGPGLRRA